MPVELNKAQLEMLAQLKAKKKINTTLKRKINKNKHDFELIGRYLHEQQDEATLQEIQAKLNAAYSRRQRKNVPDLYKLIHQNWMQELPSEIKEKSILDIVMPGTHDSAAYKINNALTPKGKWKHIGLWASIGNIIGVKRFLKNYTLTQDYSIYDQLLLGVRSFDFRVFYDEKKKRFGLSHSLGCIELDTALADINRFMQSHPGEFIIFGIKPDWEHRKTMTPEAGDKLHQLLDKTYGSLLIPNNQEISALTLNKMTQTNQRILVCSDCEQKTENPHIWPGSTVRSAWLNLEDKSKAMTKIGALLDARNNKPNTEIKEIPFTLTPSTKLVTTAAKRKFLPFAHFKYKKEMKLRDMAETMNAELKTTLEARRSNGVFEAAKYGNVVPLDFVGHAPNAHDVIQLNRPKKI